MKAGKLTKRIIIQTSTVTVDGEGMITQSWATFATVWAAVEPLMGREYLLAGQISEAISTRFRIRHLAGVTAAMRISYDSKTYAITTVIDVNEEHREMILMAGEVI